MQNNYVAHLTAPIAIAAHDRGIALHDVSAGDRVVAAMPAGQWRPILVMGSVLFVDRWARGDATLSRWIFWDDTQYDAALWSRVLGERYLNAGGKATTAEAFFASTLGAMHVRPRSGVKLIGDKPATESAVGQFSLSGLVATPNELAEFKVAPATQIWVSPPRPIHAEVRVWMIAGKSAAASTYRVANMPLRSRSNPLVGEAVIVAERLHDVWHPGRHYVADLALVNGGWVLVEYNPIHSAGWYDADPGAVLDAYIAAETDVATPPPASSPRRPNRPTPAG